MPREGETEREMVERHIAQGEVSLARQRKVVRDLGARGAPTGRSEVLLANLRKIQDQHEAHLTRLDREGR